MQNSRFSQSFKRLLLNQFGEFKLYYILGIICLVMTHKIQSELPFMAKDLADKVATRSSELNVSIFFWLALGIVIFRTTSRILFFYPARQLQKFLRSDLILKIERTSPLRFRHLNSGQLFQYLTGDIDQIRALIGFVGLQGGNFIIAMFILIPKIISFSSHLLLALSPMLMTFVIFTVLVSRNRNYFKKTQEAQGEVQNIIIESYAGKKTIKNFHAESSFTSLFSETSLKEQDYFYLASLPISITMPLISLGVGVSLLWGALIIKNLHLPASSLILFSGFIFLFMEPLSYLSWIGVVISRSSASWKRLQELDDQLMTILPEEIQLEMLNPHSLGFQFYIPFWDKSLELKFLPSKWNVLVSKTGQGKSELLFKCAEVLTKHKVSISLVAQDPFIYNDSIEKNIFLGRTYSDADRINAQRVLKILGLDYLEPDLDKLLKVEVGENGKRLSGGQIKRLSLVRSIMSGAEVLLWDDPFSSVDLILEKEIIAELRNQQVLKNKTVILTSHRLSTVKNSDEVIFFDKEQGIIEQGEVGNILSGTTKLYEYFQKQMV